MRCRPAISLIGLVSGRPEREIKSGQYLGIRRARRQSPSLTDRHARMSACKDMHDIRFIHMSVVLFISVSDTLFRRPAFCIPVLVPYILSSHVPCPLATFYFPVSLSPFPPVSTSSKPSLDPRYVLQMIMEKAALGAVASALTDLNEMR